MTFQANRLLRGLYVITDEKLIPQNRLTEIIEQVLLGGARIIQYRDKSTDSHKRLHQATELKTLCDKYQATFIINDDIELALCVNADGVHIGKQDETLASTRKQLGHKIIGVSCYNQFALALEAEKNGADYIAFGSFFPSSTKPDAARASTTLLTHAKNELNIPICAIGGITLDNASSVIQAGTDMVAVITDVLKSKNIEFRCNQLTAMFNQIPAVSFKHQATSNND